VDYFRLYEEPDDIFVRGKGSFPDLVREICAGDDVDLLLDEAVTYLYNKSNRRGRPDYGEGDVHISIGGWYFVVEASATPANIQLGDLSQLDADVIAGTATPPFTYEWTSNPPGQIMPGDETLKDPIVSPQVSTRYTVAVTDADGMVDDDSVLVNVGLALTVLATPDVIDVGESSQLLALVAGGAPPYEYSWVPLSSLDDAAIPNPLASPVNTTIYQVTVNDSGTNEAIDTIMVRVRMNLTVMATPDTIDAGETSQLDVSVAGGVPPYTYRWDPADGLDPADETIANPVVTPSATTTYNVTVTDADGTASGSVEVTVNAPSLAACFEVTPDPPDLHGDRELWDASCSVGKELQYRWEFSVPDLTGYKLCFGKGATPDGWNSTSCSSFDFEPSIQTIYFGLEGPAGHPLRVELFIKDANGDVVSTYKEYQM
jgi:hypothetical protein